MKLFFAICILKIYIYAIIFNYFSNFSTNLAHLVPILLFTTILYNEKRKSKKIFVYISGYNSLHTTTSTTTPLITHFLVWFFWDFEKRYLKKWQKNYGKEIWKKEVTGKKRKKPTVWANLCFSESLCTIFPESNNIVGHVRDR